MFELSREGKFQAKAKDKVSKVYVQTILQNPYDDLNKLMIVKNLILKLKKKYWNFLLSDKSGVAQ